MKKYEPNNYIQVIDGLSGEVFYKQVDLVLKEIKKAEVDKLNNSKSVADFLRTYAYDNNVETYEQFYVLYLDRALHVLGLHHVSKGGIVGTVADIRLICETALRLLASSVILSHNHPSGNLTPSQADINLTKNTKEALKNFEIAVVDHIIVTKDGHYSFADESMLGLEGIKEVKFLKGLENLKTITMITKDNYYSEIERIGIKNLPVPMQEMHELINQLTTNGSDWGSYDKDPELQEYCKVQFSKLQELIDKSKKPVKSEQPAKAKKTPAEKPKKKKAEKEKEIPAKIDNAKTVASIDTEVRFIKRYVSLHGKTWEKEKIHSFLSSLQAAIVKKQIRKTSEFAEEIVHVQKELIKLYNTMANSSKIDLEEKELAWLQPIAFSEKQALSVRFIIRYINLYKKSKKPTGERVAKLKNEIDKALKNGGIPDNCPYLGVVKEILSSLSEYENSGRLKVNDYELNGLLGTCECSEGLGTVIDKHKILKAAKNPFPYIAAFTTGVISNVIANQISDRISKRSSDKVSGVINSNDLKTMDFKTIGLQGEFKNLIGDPAVGFSAMVYGLPKGGKSTLCIKFAKYLAEHHGKVLYIGLEEQYGYTIKEKFERTNAYHPNLDLAEKLPVSFNGYDFIFIDSITRAKLEVKDLRKMIKDNPGKSFIFVFHSTKDGNFRGELTFQHDVDVVIKVNDGLAQAYGRFNQGGEMRVL